MNGLFVTHFFTPLVSELPSTALSSLAIFDHWTNQIPIVALMGAWCASLVDMIVRMSCVLRRFNSGKWLVIDVKSPEQLEDIKRLILLKARPPKAKK